MELNFFQSALASIGLVIYWVLYAATNLACTYFVYQDSIKQPRLALKISPYWWAAFSLFGGIWTALIYWLMQHSTLSRQH